ncbi:MAG: hypothetical protein U1F43_33485 [Myxococcota bacterium]
MSSGRLGATAAIGTMAGILLSGPLGILVVELTHPQPPWADAATFERAFHPIQSLPYLFGFLLVGSLVALLASLHRAASAATKARTTVALVLAAVFASMVFINYMLQTTFVPELARHARPEDHPLVAALTMANPTSLAWALEMWGYGFLGAATWLVAPVFGELAPTRLGRATAFACVANGVVSIASAALTAMVPGWEITPGGTIGFAVWNALLFALAALAYRVLRAAPR